MFLLFLIIAILVLILSKLNKSQTKTFNFNVSLNNLPKEYVILNDSANLYITLKAQGYKLLKYYLRQPTIDLEFKDQIRLNDSTYIWERNNGFSALNTQMDQEIDILSITPDTLYFNYDVNSVKYVNVVLKQRVEYLLGYDLKGDFKIQPDSIKLIGPKTLLDKIDVIDTDSMILAKVNKNISRKLNLRLPDNSETIKFVQDFVEVKGQVEKFTEGKLKVPITIDNLPDSLKIKTFPKEVNLTFYTSLSDFNLVKASDFRVVCDFNQVSTNKAYLIPKLVKTSKHVKSARLNLNRIEYIITE